jgi:hypothetical protein
MKNLVVTLTALAAVSGLYSCDKENNPGPDIPPVTYGNYSRLKTGNYWIYQRFNVDSLGNATPTNTFDSCYVEKDTSINNITYYKVVRKNPYILSDEFTYQRDSLHYLVTSTGSILFSSEDFTTVFESEYYIINNNDTVCEITSRMSPASETITVPAGTFSTLNMKQTYEMYPAWSFSGNVRTRNNRYAENVGMVTETLMFFQSNPNYSERRLVRYHLEP